MKNKEKRGGKIEIKWTDWKYTKCTKINAKQQDKKRKSTNECDENVTKVLKKIKISIGKNLDFGI